MRAIALSLIFGGFIWSLLCFVAIGPASHAAMEHISSCIVGSKNDAGSESSKVISLSLRKLAYVGMAGLVGNLFTFAGGLLLIESRWQSSKPESPDRHKA